MAQSVVEYLNEVSDAIYKLRIGQNIVNHYLDEAARLGIDLEVVVGLQQPRRREDGYYLAKGVQINVRNP